jgi:hypothetical protein
MKFLILLLAGMPAFASESFNDGAARIAHEFAQSRDRVEPMQARVNEYFGVASATFHMNSPWYEMREGVEKFFRENSNEARIAWFEPTQLPAAPGQMLVSYPYVVKTDLPASLLPSTLRPLRELVILAIARVDMDGSKWQIATEVPDHDLIHWNQMLGQARANPIQGYKTGAIMVARFGNSPQSRWRLVEAYEFGKPSPSRPQFRVLRAKPEAPLKTADIIAFRPRCERNVTK